MGTRTAILPRLEKQEGCHRPPEIRHRPLPRTETADQQGSAEPKSLLPLPGEADTGISGGAVKVLRCEGVKVLRCEDVKVLRY